MGELLVMFLLSFATQTADPPRPNATTEYGEQLLPMPTVKPSGTLTVKQWDRRFANATTWPGFRHMFRKGVVPAADPADVLRIYLSDDADGADVIEWRATVNRVPLRFLSYANGMRTVIPLPAEVSKRREFAERFVTELLVLDDDQHRPPIHVQIPWPAVLEEGSKFANSRDPVTGNFHWFNRLDFVVLNGELHLLTYYGNPMTLAPRAKRWLPKDVLDLSAPPRQAPAAEQPAKGI